MSKYFGIFLLLAACLPFGYTLSPAHEASELTFRLSSRGTQCVTVESTVPEDRLYVHFESTSDAGEVAVDFSILSPDSIPLFEHDRVSEHQVLLRAHQVGNYSICFRNEHNYIKYVSVLARLGAESGVQAVQKRQRNAQPDSMIVGIARVQQLIQEIRYEQAHIASREAAIRSTAEETNARILWGSIIQISILIFMSVAQIQYLKRAFGTRRQV